MLSRSAPLALAMAFLSLFAAPIASAQTTPATPAATPVVAARAFEGLYSIRARGVTAGEFSFSAALRPLSYEATATRRTTGAVRALAGGSQDYRYTTRGALGEAGPQPEAYEHQGGKKNRLVKVAFSPTGPAVTTATPAMGMGNPPATDAQKSGVMDQVSALVAILATPAGRDPCARTIPVLMDGRARFDFVMTPDGREQVRTPGFSGQVLRCKVLFRPVAGFSDPQEAATLSFLLAPMEGGLYAPVRIQMPTDDVGVVTLDAKRLTVAR